MIRLTGNYRAVWDLLFHKGTPRTTAQLAAILGIDSKRMVQVVSNLKNRRLIAECEPAPGTHAIRYEVNGMCVAPQGATLAELQYSDARAES
jgi:chromosome segregation and condensation protein ScpB